MTKGGIKTRYAIKFFNENLIFYALPDEASSIGAHSSDECAGTIPDERSQRASPTTEWSTQHSTWEPRLSPGRNSGPSYNAIDFSMKSQEGYYQNPSIITEQTILSSSENLERMESLDSNNPSNLSFSKQYANPAIIEENLQSIYLPEYLDSLYPSYIPHLGEFNDGFTFFTGMHRT
ncbi:hypothetical protein PNOK_0909700 [Pyrrhoderma noxium]|uniref:Uncharacterized protein n=1 Tax=Pyrrhoderma noxium TaxID=2282107 RepID=A0A286U6Y5_9AGAM|nr:hypothetical protein PNOK_0909700 [Pyrrhoderma noxium]